MLKKERKRHEYKQEKLIFPLSKVKILTTEDKRRKFALLVNKINSLIFSVHPSSFRLPGYIVSLDLLLQWNKAEKSHIFSFT